MTLREILKGVARGCATIAILPPLTSYYLRRLFLGDNRALEGSTQALALWPGVLGQYLRRAFLGRVLASCAPSATVEFGSIFSQVGARIGPNAYIGPRCHIGLVEIGSDVLIAAGVHIPSGAHTHATENADRPIREQDHHRTLVRVGAGAWIGSGAVIMADIGEHSIVGAGSVVVKPLPPFVVAAGVPARVIRDRHLVPVAPAQSAADGQSAT